MGKVELHGSYLSDNTNIQQHPPNISILKINISRHALRGCRGINLNSSQILQQVEMRSSMRQSRLEIWVTDISSLGFLDLRDVLISRLVSNQHSIPSSQGTIQRPRELYEGFCRNWRCPTPGSTGSARLEFQGFFLKEVVPLQDSHHILPRASGISVPKKACYSQMHLFLSPNSPTLEKPNLLFFSALEHSCQRSRNSRQIVLHIPVLYPESSFQGFHYCLLIDLKLARSSFFLNSQALNPSMPPTVTSL